MIPETIAAIYAKDIADKGAGAACRLRAAEAGHGVGEGTVQRSRPQLVPGSAPVDPATCDAALAAIVESGDRDPAHSRPPCGQGFVIDRPCLCAAERAEHDDPVDELDPAIP